MSNKTDLQEVVAKLTVLDINNPNSFGDKFTSELETRLNLSLQNNWSSSFNVGGVNFVVDKVNNKITWNTQVLNSNFTLTVDLPTGSTLDTPNLLVLINSYFSGVFAGLGIPVTAEQKISLTDYVDSLPDE